DGKIDKTLVFQNLPSTPLPEATLRFQADLMKSMNKKFADAAKPYYGPARLFMAQWCGYCKQAKVYLAEKGIPYQEYDIDTQAGGPALAEPGGPRGAPVFVANGQRVQGFSRSAYDALFAKPKWAALDTRPAAPVLPAALLPFVRPFGFPPVR